MLQNLEMKASIPCINCRSYNSIDADHKYLKSGRSNDLTARVGSSRKINK